MVDSVSKALFHLIAQSRTLKKLASRYGMRRPSSFARRFIAGETVADAIAAARAVEARGMLISLDLLGESVATLAAADVATREYLDVIDAISRRDRAHVSLKLTQLGIDVDKASAVDNCARSWSARLPPASSSHRHGELGVPDVTLEIFETLWGHGYARWRGAPVGVTRSEQDLAHINAMGARVRLVKGRTKNRSRWPTRKATWTPRMRACCAS